MKILVIHSDAGGCYIYRVRNPLNALRALGAEYEPLLFLPTEERFSLLETTINLVYHYDVVILQRHPKLRLANALRQACTILGKKLIYETDDDYLNIPEHNPVHALFSTMQAKAEFCEILRIVDMVTVSTEELRRLYSLFNRNVVVLPNNIENIHYFKDFPSTLGNEDTGSFRPEWHGDLLTCPSTVKYEHGKVNLVRLGYCSNRTHREDFKSIARYWFKAINKLKGKVITIYTQDSWFVEQHKEACGPDNVLLIPNTVYETYLNNIRNFDIGIAPLENNFFNMSKSSIKAVEYASWGIPAILPNYITYERDFKHEHSCLMYNNGPEFYDQVMTLVENKELREKLGNQARHDVKLNHLESTQAPIRFEHMNKLINSSTPLQLHKVEQNAN